MVRVLTQVYPLEFSDEEKKKGVFVNDVFEFVPLNLMEFVIFPILYYVYVLIQHRHSFRCFFFFFFPFKFVI